MERLSSQRVSRLFQAGQGLLKLVDFPVVFQNQNVVFFGYYLNRPFELIRFFGLPIYSLQESREG